MAYYGRFFSAQQENDDTKKDESETYASTGSRAKTKPWPGWPRASSGSSWPTNSISSRSSTKSQPSRKPATEPRRSNSWLKPFENRRQYDRAAEFWRQAIKQYGPGQNNYRPQRLAQIVDNWGRFEPVMSQPAGKGATVEFRFRNGKQVAFEAHEIHVAKLLDDVKAALKKKPRQLQWQDINVENLGYRIFEQNQKQYLGEKVAEWKLDVQPRPKHFDRRITVATPLQKAGAYLLTAKLADGNSSHIILWLEDTAIVKKPLDHGTFYFVADAVSGASRFRKRTWNFSGTGSSRSATRASSMSRPRTSRSSPMPTARRAEG